MANGLSKSEGRVWEVLMVVMGILVTVQMAVTGWLLTEVVALKEASAVMQAERYTDEDRAHDIAAQAAVDLRQTEQLVELSSLVAVNTERIRHIQREGTP